MYADLIYPDDMCIYMYVPNCNYVLLCVRKFDDSC